MTNKKLYLGPVYVKQSPIHGYGVFASENIKAGDLIEECYSLLTQDKKNSFDSFYFSAGDFVAIPFGYGCIYNHSPTPNLLFNYDSESNLLIFRAICDIRQNEELLISYGKDWFSSRKMKMKTLPLWKRLYRLNYGLVIRATIVCLSVWTAVHYFAS